MTTQKELSWANIYHDYVRGIPEIQELSLSVGRWAANYSLLYVLCKIIREQKPEVVWEFGLGESSKLISTLLMANANAEKHLIFEHNNDWKNHFMANNSLGPKSEIIPVKVVEFDYKEASSTKYELETPLVHDRFYLFVIDGPVGTPAYSRFNIVELARQLRSDQKFMIIMDDYNRPGEQQTMAELIGVLNQKQIKHYTSRYTSVKTQLVVASENIKFAGSL